MASPGECENILTELLDFSKPFNVALFDKVVDGFFMKGDKSLERVISEFNKHELAWTRVDAILEHSNSNNARIVSLNTLEAVVRGKWNIIPIEQRQGIKNFIVGLIIKISSDEKESRIKAQFLNKLNIVQVQIAKYDWPKQWPDFIKELVESSKSGQSICSNNMQILLLLSEEVFDYSKDQMTSKKVELLKDTLNADFKEIFSLCSFILGNSENAGLLMSTLKTLLRFIKWIPVDYIFEKQLLETLVLKFFPVELFQTATLRCLCEVASLNTKDSPSYNPAYDAYFLGMLTAVMTNVYKRIPVDQDLATLYQDGSDNFQKFLRYLALFLNELIRSHLRLFENASDDSRRALQSAIALLLRQSLIDDLESDVVIFNICLEFWIAFLRNIYEDTKLGKGANSVILSGPPPRVRFYEEALVQLRSVMICRMAKPEEVLVVTDEHGNVVKETLKNTDSINLYISMREALIYLTHLDAPKTMEMMCGQLSHIVNTEWTPVVLNRLCWAIGSISKALSELQEKSFLARVIKDLLLLVDKKRHKEHKAIIAANIMYVVGQYPRFLKSHHSFLTTVVSKLFEFMHEKHPGVQDMACDTFLKIANKCRTVIVVDPNNSGSRPFIEEILHGLSEAIKDLEQAQVLVFYEACARIISAEQQVQKREALLFRLMEIPNRIWTNCLSQVKENMDLLWTSDTVNAIEMVLKTNNRVAKALKTGFMAQLTRIYVEMLQLYQLYSTYVSRKIESEGEIVTKTVAIRKMRSIKKEVLRILITFVENCKQDQIVYQRFLPELITPILDDYSNNTPVARDPEVMQVFTAFVKEFKLNMVGNIPRIFASTFITLEMITKNFEDFPEHRLAFYNMIYAVADNCFEAILKLGEAEFKLIMDSVFWGMKHLDRTIQETGLNTLIVLLSSFQRTEVANSFYKHYLITIVNEILEVFTDTFHRSSFSLHCKILANIIQITETNVITIPIDPNNAFPTNSAYLRNHIATLFRDSFSNLTPQQIMNLITQLFTTYDDARKFSGILKDFLIQLKEFQSFEDEIINQEKEQNAIRAKNELYASVAGLEYTRGFLDHDDD